MAALVITDYVKKKNMVGEGCESSRLHLVYDPLLTRMVVANMANESLFSQAKHTSCDAAAEEPKYTTWL